MVVPERRNTFYVILLFVGNNFMYGTLWVSNTYYNKCDKLLKINTIMN